MAERRTRPDKLPAHDPAQGPHRNWQPGPKDLPMTRHCEPPTLFEDYSQRQSHRDQAMIDRDLNANDLKLVPPTNLTPDQLKT